MLSDLDRFINTVEASKIIGCSNAHVRYMLITGRMQGKKVSGRTWMIEREEAEKIANEEHQTGRPRKGRAG